LRLESKSWKLFLISMLIPFSTVLIAQPSPGDVFKEYRWFNDVEDCGGALRVGGKLDYRLTGKALPVDVQGHIVPDFDMDMENALKAELVVEKMLYPPFQCGISRRTVRTEGGKK